MQRLLDLLTGRSDEPGLDRAALEIACIEYPNLDVEPFIGILDSYAVELSDRLEGRLGGADYVETANQFLFEELGFKGNAGNYYDPCNSCLNDVVTARVGIPITLAVVYLEIGRRLARPVAGIGLPGHFLVQYRDADFSTFIDVFEGGRLLTEAECYDLSRKATGAPFRDDPRLLAPVGQREILIRMLRNLRGVYIGRLAYHKALQVLDLLLTAEPHSAEDYKQRGIIQMRLRNAAAARGDFENYLRLAPEAGDRGEVEKRLQSLRSYQAGLN